MGSRKDGVGKRKRRDPTNLEHAPRDAQSWTEIMTEGGRRFMTEWRKEEEEKSKTRQERAAK